MNVSDSSEDVIIFVYNADSGLLNSIKDFAWRISSPDTYPCNLCAVTYSNFGMKDEWREFVEDLEFKIRFFHRDEFDEKFERDEYRFPAAFLRTGSSLEPFISKEEIERCKHLQELIELVETKIDEELELR